MVMAAWGVGILLVEIMQVGTVDRDLFAGNWEIVEARRLVAPIAIGALLPLSLLASLVGDLFVRATQDRRARLALALSGGLAVGALGYGVSVGRHLHAPSVRIPFVALFALAGAASLYLAPRVVSRLAPWAFAATGLLVGASAWVANVRILPRTYPAFHQALFVLLLAGVAWSVVAFRPQPARASRGELGWFAPLVVGLACLGWTPVAAQKLRLADNVRFVLSERTVLLGRAAELAALLAPPPPLDDDAASSASAVLTSTGEVPRALDWTGHDVLLVSVDALRADHVSAYGYPRPTTPNLDALAHEGALFEEAYCPTPHTSYSITSLMTGKAIRPLMALGLGGGSETWAAQLRRYGYRTAAFYPPAVFYIDADRFGAFEESRLDFEYAKVQFSSAEQRVEEVARYLDGATKAPLFLWVHLFEPHEPYVMHPAQPFGGAEPKPIDAYDSEVAYSDAAIGQLVALVRSRRPGVTVLVTADHGEEFGEHGGRYHGTTCYEEQVHVPLVVVGPGVPAGRVKTVVQTIDLLPTVLSALGIPRPARVRGRDLGPLLAGAGQAKDDPGLGYAETDDYALVARGMDRLVCARKVAACTLYDVGHDPLEKVDQTHAHPEVTRELRAVLAGVEHDVGRYEAGAAPWPDPIRRGLLRDADAAVDAAALLDDANLLIRRKAAEVMFLLHTPQVAGEVRRALGRDEDSEVRDWCALALVRMGEPPSPLANQLLRDDLRAWRRRAALAFASQGDRRGAGELAAFWQNEAPPRGGLDVEDAKELLAALSKIRDTEAVPALALSLPFVPLRPFIADTLGAVGDPRGRPPLLELFQGERYETARAHEARALLQLGAKKELYAPLERFAGLPEPMIDSIAIARDAKLLLPASGGVALDSPRADVEAHVTVPTAADAGEKEPLRLLVLAAGEGGTLTGSVGGEALGPGIDVGAVHIRDLSAGDTGQREASIVLELHEPQRVLAAWLVRRREPPIDLRPPDK
jgi:hypothetical protein